MKRQTDKPNQIAVVEWDFRLVQEDRLESAIHYEYARSASWLVKKFTERHKLRIGISPDSQDFRNWHGKTVGEVLAFAENHELPTDVANALSQTYPDWWEEGPFSDIDDISIFFPKPFQLLETVWPDIETDWPDIQNTPKAFSELPTIPQRSRRQIEREKEMGIHTFAARIDLRAGKMKINKAFKDFLQKLPKHVRVGRAAAKPWHKLKELAAYRLQTEAGLSWEQVKDYIEANKMRHSLVSGHGGSVLPRYASSGAWSDAVNSARALIRKRFPEPT
jgi:hypothetical protein